ncbi:uncharacterized protein EAE98_006619 [Botrytis deweyae]|uniref:Uncharacterized protein n=1 Tax=Botrytis deweyae TaxID=2478750 RepID=A0ABQ7IJU8_9HELO|nr:uncharacterized protein EAE98_006619 [Botrytis deweyae]KAF7926324.1 hypothetical protein EAE98_006619 [Botrytis deweyae]
MSDPESNHRSPTPPHALRRRGHQTLRRNSDRHSYAGLDRSPRFPNFLHPPRNNELNWNRRGNNLISDIDIRRTEELVPEQSGAASFAPFPRNGVLATKGVEAVWNMDSSQDITVHLDFECDENIEAHVEELSRLRRLGDFEAALQYIESCPDECRNNMDFAVNYADILLMQGDLDYKKLERLGLTFPKIYQQCIDCAIFKMKFVRASGSEFDYDACNLLELEMAKELKPDFPRLDSMQVKLLCNWLRLDEASNIAKRVSTAEWKTLYNHLASQNRVSDMRDLFHTMSESDVMSAIHGWFEMDLVSENSISDFVARWTESRDEFTDIALLDVLASMCLQIFLNYVYPRKEYVRHASQCIEYARQFANSVSSNSPEDTKSESYLTWILAEEKLSRILKRSEPRLINHFRGFPGIVIWQRDLPIYVPFSNENPGWVIDEPLRRSDDLLELGLNTARELGNFSLEGKFLEEIILGSQAPLELLRERARLQKDVQGYRQGYLATCLTRYLVAANETVQRELYDDLSNFDDEEIGFPADRGDAIMLKWCQNRIQRALCISLRGTKEQLDIHTRKEVFLHKKVSENHPELFESNMRAMAVNEQNDSSLRIGRNHNDISYLWYEKSSVAKDERYWENRPRRMFESINTDNIELSGEEMQSESDMNESGGRIYSSERDGMAQGKKTARSLGKHFLARQQANGVHIDGIGRTGARGSLYGNTSDEDDIHGEEDPHHTVTQNRYDKDAYQSETSIYYSDQESLDN